LRKKEGPCGRISKKKSLRFPMARFNQLLAMGFLSRPDSNLFADAGKGCMGELSQYFGRNFNLQPPTAGTHIDPVKI